MSVSTHIDFWHFCKYILTKKMCFQLSVADIYTFCTLVGISISIACARLAQVKLQWTCLLSWRNMSPTATLYSVLQTEVPQSCCLCTSSLLTPSSVVSRLLSSSDNREASPWLLASCRDTSSWRSSTWACSCCERPRAASASCHASASWKHKEMHTHGWTEA